MTARDQLVDLLRTGGYHPTAALALTDAILKRHARELAEQVRGTCSRAGAACADAIDPEER